MHIFILFQSSSLRLIAVFSRLNPSVFISKLQILFLLATTVYSRIIILILELECVLALRTVFDHAFQMVHQLILLVVETES